MYIKPNLKKHKGNIVNKKQQRREGSKQWRKGRKSRRATRQGSAAENEWWATLIPIL